METPARPATHTTRISNFIIRRMSCLNRRRTTVPCDNRTDACRTGHTIRIRTKTSSRRTIAMKSDGPSCRFVRDRNPGRDRQMTMTIPAPRPHEQ